MTTMFCANHISECFYWELEHLLEHLQQTFCAVASSTPCAAYDIMRKLQLHRSVIVIADVQVFKEEEEAIKVDLHEGCGRTKLFWVMALADSKTLKAMVEFRENSRGMEFWHGLDFTIKDICPE